MDRPTPLHLQVLALVGLVAVAVGILSSATFLGLLVAGVAEALVGLFSVGLPLALVGLVILLAVGARVERGGYSA